MEQRCHLAMVWLTWLGLPLLAAIVGLRSGAVAGVVVLGAGVDRPGEGTAQRSGSRGQWPIPGRQCNVGTNF